MIELKEKVYELMCGSWNLEDYPVPESTWVSDAFAKDKPCDRLYIEVCEANERLCERLHVAEDADIECIIGNLLEIAHILSLQMFEYGVLSTKQIKP